MISTLTSKTQITLHRGIRELLGPQPGDNVDFAPQPDGRITMTKAPRVGQASPEILRDPLTHSLSGLTALQK